MVEARLWTSKDDRRERQVRSCWNQMPQPWEPTLSLLPVTHTELPRVRCSPKQFNSEASDEQIACELVLPQEHCPGIAVSRGNGKHQLWEFTHKLLGLGIYLFPAYWLLCWSFRASSVVIFNLQLCLGLFVLNMELGLYILSLMRWSVGKTLDKSFSYQGNMAARGGHSYTEIHFHSLQKSVFC